LPFSYYFVDGWLKTFACRISLGPMIFMSNVAIVLTLMVLTVFDETIKAARANPVHALKHE